MISVLISSPARYPVDKKRVRNVISEYLKTKIKRDAEVSVVVVGDRMMRNLNNTYRKRDYPTDVLSFSLTESQSGSTDFIQIPDNILRLGDIVVSYPQAVKEAAEQNKLVDDMIDFLILHGLDHLLGIHHPE